MHRLETIKTATHNLCFPFFVSAINYSLNNRFSLVSTVPRLTTISMSGIYNQLVNKPAHGQESVLLLNLIRTLAAFEEMPAAVLMLKSEFT